MLKLYTVKTLDGFDTFATQNEQKALELAEVYYPGAVEGLEPEAHVCHCESKWARDYRVLGWLICARPECAGRIG